MIHQNDILMFSSSVDAGDDECVMVALEDEYIWDNLPNKVKVFELNSWTPLGSVRVLTSDSFKIVGRVRTKDTKESIVKRFLPENKWKFTRELYQKNRRTI